MRAFLCGFKDFSLAIPINSVSSITLYKGIAEKTIEYNEENNNTYISLPRLLKYPQALIHHGIILKNKKNDEGSAIIKNRNIFLTPEIECETDIPEEKIYPFPKILKGIKYSVLFGGLVLNLNYQKKHAVSYSGEGTLILVLNTWQIVKRIKKNNKKESV